MLAWQNLLVMARSAAPGQASGELDEAEIDRLVLGRYEPAVAPDDEVASRLAEELAAVRMASAATGDGRWDDAQAALRGVSARSVFRHWRMFLRGVRCVFQDDRETARQCFAGLPPQGGLACAARTLAPGLAPAGPAAPLGARVALFLAMTGQPSAWAQPITAAVSLWHAGKRVQAFLDLLAAMKGAFPATTPGLPAVLTEAMLPFCEQMDEHIMQEIDQLVAKWRPFDESRLISRPQAALCAVRGACLTKCWDTTLAGIQKGWQSCVELWNLAHGPDPLRDSMLWQRAGNDLADLVGEDEAHAFFSSKPDYSRARAMMQKAVERDPANESAWMDLVELAARDNDQKTVNKLLDDLSQRFPDNKQVLLRLGVRAVERKAFGKGLTALRKALALDPLDHATRGLVAEALISQIRDYRRKHRPQAPLWEELEPLLNDRSAPGRYGACRWLARLHRALLDTDKDAAAQALAAAVELAPSDAERLFAESWITRACRLTTRTSWKKDWSALKRSGKPGWPALWGCIELASELGPFDEEDFQGAVLLRSMLRELCKAIAGPTMRLDPDGLLVLLDRARSFPRQHQNVLGGTLYACLDQLLGVLLTHFKRDPAADVRLRLAQHLIDELLMPKHLLPHATLFLKFDEIERAGEAAGLPGVVTRVRALRQRWREVAQRAAPPWPADGGYGEGEDWEDDEDEDDEAWEDDEPPADFSDDDVRLFRLLRESLERGDDADKQAAVQALLEIGAGQEMIDGVIRAIEASRQRPRPPRKAKPLPPDPAQPELPF